MRRALIPLIALLALLGLGAAGTGIGLRTVWLPEDTVTATADLSKAGPAAVTAPGVLEMRPGPVTVSARGKGDATVHIARIREQDALAWLKGSQHAVITGLKNETTLATTQEKGEPTIPNPAESVLWLDGEKDKGDASYTWNSASGRYLLVVAGDGTAAAPATLTMTWPREVSTPAAVPLIVGGIIALMLALGAGAALHVRSRRTPAEPGETAAPGTQTDETVPSEIGSTT